ncbi:PREDICTED: protein spitz-like isoform X3 [Polistes dominula]|uniref:Protein spitz-like isoform X3 n=1 Tax=Polistes dominula TaxID=743375 RepID=A0ABM1I3V0_POLDO|nr:PREDICTED: protein spitz-like isoform X3 [Polistes dominula]
MPIAGRVLVAGTAAHCLSSAVGMLRFLARLSDACSSRSTPKPRPPTPTPRPNITFHMYTCPPDYAQWYCLNGATCFTVKIVDSLLYNCLCANGYIGQRCEFKDLDGSYLPSRQRVMLETASIASGATIAVFLVVIICIAAYIHCKKKQKELRTSSNCFDTVDGPGRDPERRPFSNQGRSLMIYMAKNPPNNSATIEQTKMPEWNRVETMETTRMASISECKRSSQ